MKIFLFGDSITYGEYDTVYSGWADRLKLFAHQEYVSSGRQNHVTVYNLGIGGENTGELLKRFVSETKVRLYNESREDLYFIFAFGMNDAALKEGKFIIDSETFVENLRSIITEARNFSDKIALISTTPVNEEFTCTPNRKGKTRENKFIDQYNVLVQDLCESEKVDFIDVAKEFKKSDYKKFVFEDGIHPNSEGHEIIFRTVRDYFKNQGIFN